MSITNCTAITLPATQIHNSTNVYLVELDTAELDYVILSHTWSWPKAVKESEVVFEDCDVTIQGEFQLELV